MEEIEQENIEQEIEQVNEDSSSDDSSSSTDDSLSDARRLNPSLLTTEERIGSGASANVHRGIYNNVPVAVKILNSTSKIEQKYKQLKRFEREIFALTSLSDHENVVKFVGFSDADPNKLMIATELVEGDTLDSYFQREDNKRPNLKLAMSFALDISRAMQYVHGQGFIHRDLKPGNLLISVKEDKRLLKLADFGLAIKKESTEEMTYNTGTIPWLAPEGYSLSKKHDFGHKADVFGFSMILWQLLTNKIPFAGMKRKAIERAVVLKNQRPSVAELHRLPRANNFASDVQSLLQSCWAVKPADRPEFEEITDRLTTLSAALTDFNLENEDEDESAQPLPMQLCLNLCLCSCLWSCFQA